MIYAIQSGEHTKIGYATDCARRLRQMQTGNPAELQLLLAIPGDRKLEQQLHAYLDLHRDRGEWFSLHAWVDTEISSWLEIAREVVQRAARGLQQHGELPPLPYTTSRVNLERIGQP